MALSIVQCRNEIVRYCSVLSNIQRLKSAESYHCSSNTTPTYVNGFEWKQYNRARIYERQSKRLGVPTASLMRKFYNSVNDHLYAVIISDWNDSRVLIVVVDYSFLPL